MRNAQRLRMRRFAMSVATYCVVILATGLMTRLGLGMMSPGRWGAFIGIALLGNCVFFILFRTNANLRFSDPSLTREQIVYSAFWGLVPLHGMPEARPVILMFYLPAYSFGVLRLTRRQYFRVTVCVMGLYASLLAVEYSQARSGFSIQYEMFLFVLFGILLTWFAIFGGYVTGLRHRLRAQNEEIRIEIEERRRAHIEKDNLILELKDALAKVKSLSGLLPICASCKRIRDDRGYWNQLESYVREHSTAEFSHGICPECTARLYPELRLPTSPK